MTRDKTLLIGVDDSGASTESVAYVASMMAGRQDCQIVLFHVLPPIPPKLREFGGAEDPETEQRLNAALKQERAQWVENAKKAAEPILEKATTILYRAGMSPERTTTLFAQSNHRPDIVRELIEAAAAHHCGTIVVGREIYSTLKEMLHSHVAEELVRKARGVAIWVIA